MEELLEKMNKFWETHEATEEDCGLYFFDEMADPDKAGEVIGLMWKWLFIGGKWNYITVTFLREHGYHFKTFEEDSFGILVAGVGKDNKWFSIA